MTGVDWLIVAFTFLLAVYGYLQGFIVGVLSLVGFAVGAVLGTRLGPLLLPAGSHSRYAPLFGLLGALLAGGVLASGFEGLAVRARAALRLPGLRTVDGLLGAVLTACVGLGIAWIVGAIALQSTGSRQLHVDIQDSAILRELNRLLPPSGPILNALARFDPQPEIRGPTPDVAPPARGILSAGGVVRARASVVRVIGTACGLGVEGSGWVAGPDLVVTNAHVVAGESDTVVEPGGNPPGVAARVVQFDVRNDIAVLHVAGLGEPALRLAASARPETPVAILGYPLDGPYDAEPGRIGQTQPVRTQDAYGQGDFLRLITSLRGRVRPGNSGGPAVGAAGDVLGTVFAAVTSDVGAGSGAGGLAVPDSIVRARLAAAEADPDRAVGTGPCAS